MLKQYTTEQLDLLQNQINGLMSDCISINSTELSEKDLKLKYKFLYNHSDKMFDLIYKDMYNKTLSELVLIQPKITKLIKMLMSQLRDFQTSGQSHFDASKNYEKTFRNELWDKKFHEK